MTEHHSSPPANQSDEQGVAQETASPCAPDIAQEQTVQRHTVLSPMSGNSPASGSPSDETEFNPPLSSTEPSSADSLASPAELLAKIETLQGENVRLSQEKDFLMRKLAELDNLRKRIERDRDNERKYAIVPFAREFLVVIDSLQSALALLPEPTQEEDPLTKQFRPGLELTMRQVETLLERFAILKIEPLHTPFDPRRHRAMFEQPSSEYPSGTVLQVLQTGYILHDRLLREAFVGVSRDLDRSPASAVRDALTDDHIAPGTATDDSSSKTS